MLPSLRSLSQTLRRFTLIALATVLVSCGHTTRNSATRTTQKSSEESNEHLALVSEQNSIGPISDKDLISMARGNNIILCAQLYNRAKDAFKNTQWDRALELTEGLATAPTSHTEHTHLRVRSQTLRTLIYTGQLQGNMALAEAYGQGVDKAKNPRIKAENRRLQNVYIQAAAQATLSLAETARQLALHGIFPKREPLEASLPTTESPVEMAALALIKNGNGLESSQQQSAAAGSLLHGMHDAVAEVFSGDAAKARQALSDGPTYIDGVPFAIYISQGLADGTILFDHRHIHDSLKMRALCDEGQQTLKAAQARLKANSDTNTGEEEDVERLKNRFDTLLSESQ